MGCVALGVVVLVMLVVPVVVNGMGNISFRFRLIKFEGPGKLSSMCVR